MILRYTAFVACLIFIFITMSGCSCNLEVTRPPIDGQNVTPYYSFKAEITGSCTDCTIESFRADLDTQDITNMFTCSGGECDAALAFTQSGGHMLKVEADLYSDSYLCKVGNESDERQFNVAIEGKEALSRPALESPLYECATAVTVSGFVPGAKIEIFANGSVSIGQGISDSPEGERFSVNPPLTAGQKITATQTFNGVMSQPSNEVVVESYFDSHPEGLPKPTLDTPIHDCGGAIGVRNLVSGGLLEVFVDNNLVGSVNGCGSGQWLFVSPLFEKGQDVFATETLCDQKSPESDHVEVIEAPTSLPAPTVGDVYEEGTRVVVRNITNGAMVKVYNGTQQVAGHYCSGGGQVFRLNPPPTAGDTLTAVQSLCDITSDPSDPQTVKECSQLPAPKIMPICPGEDYVTVAGNQPDARIRVYANGNLVGDGGGNRINLFYPLNLGDVVVATQQVGTCFSPVSSPTVVLNNAAPAYNPAYWNDPSIVTCNNCYNYGTDIRTDTYAQPGYAHGVSHLLDCPTVGNAAKADGLTDSIGEKECSGCTHMVALVIAPDWPRDYHWYRLDNNGRWSHKPDRRPATDRDASNNLITDPETADRRTIGPDYTIDYKVFCGYYCVDKDNVVIDGSSTCSY
jgi:hypothetical protein